MRFFCVDFHCSSLSLHNIFIYSVLYSQGSTIQTQIILCKPIQFEVFLHPPRKMDFILSHYIQGNFFRHIMGWSV